MRHFIIIGTLSVLLYGCGKENPSLRSASNAHLNAAEPAKGNLLPVLKSKLALDSNTGKLENEDDFPAARYSWDTKMVLW